MGVVVGRTLQSRVVSRRLIKWPVVPVSALARAMSGVVEGDSEDGG